MKTIILSLLLLSLNTFAQTKFSVSQGRSTPDSSIDVVGDLAPDIRWVWIKVTKETGEKEDAIFPTASPSFAQKVYLRFGPGPYSIRVSISREMEKYSSYYRALALKIEKQDGRENMGDLFPSQDIQSESAEIQTLAREITAKSQTDMQKTRAIHDWVAGNIAYDVDPYFDGSYVLLKHDALEILRKKKAICQGYSNLTAALNRAVGLPAKVVSGNAWKDNEASTGQTNHAWNEVLIDGRWVIQDTTWDAGGIDPRTRAFSFRLSVKYFDPRPEVFEKNHLKIAE